MARKTKDEALNTRSQILDAAERVFGERGVARTSLHEIAESAGLTRGAVYWHFKDKYDLLSALWERCLLPLEAAFAEIEAKHEHDPLGRIRAKIRGVANRIVNDPRTRNMMGIALLRCEMVDEIAASRSHMVCERNDCLDKMASEFQGAIDMRQLRRDVEATTAAITLHALIDGLCYHWLLDPKQFDYEQLVGESTDAWLTGLGAEPPPKARSVRVKSSARAGTASGSRTKAPGRTTKLRT